MNEAKHWNHIAPTYNMEIFDVFQSDTKKVLTRYFKKHTNLNHTKLLPYKNVTLKQADLTRVLRVPKADFIFCCNVAILGEVETNVAIIKNIQRTLKPGGHALVVIPSLE